MVVNVLACDKACNGGGRAHRRGGNSSWKGWERDNAEALL